MVSCRQLGLSLPVQEQLPVPAYRALAVGAEAMGYSHVSIGEIAGPEVFSLLGAIAQSTRTIRFGTGVVPYNTRSPAYLAMASATLHALAPGRFFLGVGSSSPLIVEQWHGGDHARPLAAFGSFMDDFEVYRRGEAKVVEGGPDLSMMPSGGFDVPLWLAAIGPRMLAEAGRRADGAYLAFCPIDEAARRVERVRAAASEAGRDPHDVETVVSLNAYAGPDVVAARRRMEKFLATYSGVPTHRRGMDAKEWADADAERSGPPLVDQICAVGDGDEVAQRVEQYWNAGIDIVFLHVLGLAKGDVHSAMQTTAAVGAVLGDGRRHSNDRHDGSTP